MQTISNIQQNLDTNFNSFYEFVRQQNDITFTEMPDGKWSSGQHLEHLIRSTAPVLLALQLPKFLLGLFFGKTNRPSRKYEDLIVRYQQRLKDGGKASGRFIPPTMRLSQKTTKLKKFLNITSKLKSILSIWSEADLDKYILPHPLLGKLTMREMLFFTSYHTEHHLKILQEKP